MSSFGSQIRKRAKELEKAGYDVKVVMDQVQEQATIAAIEKATEKTPPNGNAKLAGVNVRSGVLAQAWSTDSVVKPKNGRTYLINHWQYASYVNDGHRVDRHFVPGLHVDGDRLDYDADYPGGLVVGTRTTYVKGLYMKEAGKGAFRRTVKRLMEQKVAEVIGKSDL